jgi:hypothetical protein
MDELETLCSCRAESKRKLAEGSLILEEKMVEAAGVGGSRTTQQHSPSTTWPKMKRLRLPESLKTSGPGT